MILLDNWVKHRGKVLVGVPVSGVDATMLKIVCIHIALEFTYSECHLVIKLNRDLNGFPQSEATGLGLHGLDFVPSLLGDVLGHQGVGRLDDGEFSRHDAEY